ncbi:SWIM zinc finger family protein [Natronomonas sp. F2-12]|uniref:SWIM zinc finger family protein n=2 Tax=Natronomonas aquatica TaxID=2841590 RepID=A0A9R1CSW5_9EURY|nr:SWIM zinc finger family protein [Natronomonas aquatica]
MTHPINPPASSDTRLRPLAPDTRRLEDRAARAWTEPMAVTPLGGGRYAVASHSGARYLVNLPDGDCSCPDHEIRGERCKHLRRVAIEVTDRRVPPPGRRRGECTVCGLPSFVPETGLPVCSDCRFERGDLATDKETGDVVVVYRQTDETAAERYVGTADCTVAEYPKNDGYPSTDPVVEVVYPFSGDRNADISERPRYAFPRSRLAAREEMLIE